MKGEMHMERMNDCKDRGVKLPRERFNRVIKKFKDNGKRSYDFLLNTGERFKEAVFRLCRRMLEEEEFPSSFDDTTLHQIYKGKGKKEILSNNRYIHCKEWLPRTAEGMVVDCMKDAILKGSSPYQIGGQPGHQPQEHIFSVKSMIAKQRMEGKVTILQAYDISKFFDKEVLEDAMNTMHELGINGKAYRTWCKLNRNTRIRVKTGVGYTDWSEEGAMIGQGTGGGALVSQANLDKSMVEMFMGSEDEIGYGGVRILPLMFQDDIMRVTDSVAAARSGNVKVASVMRSKQLCLNPDKTGFIMFGKRKGVEEARRLIERNPVMCGNFITKEKIADKWLGDMFHQEGLAASVIATIKDREAKVKGACYEAAAIIEDWRAQCVGGFQSALDLFQLAILPTLLYNSETWVELPREAEECLENLQLFFVRLVLRVPQGTPKVALRSETGLMSIKLRIYKRKCMLVHHIKNLGKKTLARQIYEEQRAFMFPGLAREVSTICSELGIEDVNDTGMEKNMLKKILQRACEEKDEKELKEKMVNKTAKLKNEDCRLKTYMKEKSLKQVRDTFRVRTNLVEGFRANFKNMYERNNLECQGCGGAMDDQTHAMQCSAYTDLREGLDMEKDVDLVLYFRRVMESRMED